MPFRVPISFSRISLILFKVFPTFFHLHGKTFDYKISLSNVMRLFMLPHKDQRQMHFVVNVDPPIKQGQTRYHYLVFNFKLDDEVRGHHHPLECFADI